MKQTMKRSLAMFMVLVLFVAFVPALSLGASAAEVDYKYSGSYIYNWGTRGTVATFLSPNAEDFYEDNNTSYDELSSLSGGTGKSDAPKSELYRELKELMVSNHSYINAYKANNDLLKYTDCQNGGGKISSFYSGNAIGPNWGEGSWNKEHTWPDSKGLSGSDEDDIMMIRPTSTSENSSRGNTAYGKSSGYYNPNKESGGKYDLRGDVARIFLYVYVRWGNTSYAWGTSGVMESVDVLLEWMEADPVDTWELGRNDSVESITGTRNVFVDYPELAFILFGEEIPADMTTPSGEAGNQCDHNNFGAGTVVPATCTEKGYTLYICQVAGCGYSYKDNIVEASGHNYVSDVCSVCGEAKTTEPTPNSTITIEQAITIGDSKEHNTTTTDKYYISGIVKEIKNTTYGNMYIQDENGNSIFVYGTYSADGSTRYDAMSVKPVAGDTVTLYGVVGNYNGAQIKNAWLVAHTPATPGETTPEVTAPEVTTPEVTTPEVTTPADNPTTPPVAGEATISFADKANRTELSSTKQVWKQNGITVTNEKTSGSANIVDYANPARFYKSSKVIISYPGMTKIVIACSSTAYANDCKGAIGSNASVNGKEVTVALDSPTDSFEFTLSVGQVRVNSITVYATGANLPDEPEITTPEITTPEETTPEETTPEETTPEETTPEETTPEVTTPEVTTPEVTTPEVTTPEETIPEETTPEESTPEETIPEESTPEGSTPAEPETPEDDSTNEEEKHVCEEVNGFKKFINAIINFFRKLFGQPELCPCGKTTIEE